MVLSNTALLATSLAPAALMSATVLLSQLRWLHGMSLWRPFNALSVAALLCALAALALQWAQPAPTWGASPLQQLPWLATNRLETLLAVLVQLLGTVIGGFSSRYLQGEPGQTRYVAAFAGVLAAVHLLLLANHWLVLIAAWAMVGVALQHLLCFYADRPFALLAAHKKHIADRLADALLLGAAALAWWSVGSGSFSDLSQHLTQSGPSISLQLSAVLTVVAVMLRTALLPVHGWLIQVMEAPTPVSALLHAGVVNLGGYVLIRFAPLLDASPAARWLLVGLGLGTALLAGLVMLTRISIKVRLAWSTVAQMGFMVLECGLGLYTLAALHLIGHSLYKAHAFLAASSVIKHSKLKMMRGTAASSVRSLIAAPALTLTIVSLVQAFVTGTTWPWWWSGVLALAWAPMLWQPARVSGTMPSVSWPALAGLCMVSGLTAFVSLAHALPLGMTDRPDDQGGLITLLGMASMYGCLVLLQLRPRALAGWRRWSYAGFYIDELYTQLALRLWPARWVPSATPRDHTVSEATPVFASK